VHPDRVQHAADRVARRGYGNLSSLQALGGQRWPHDQVSQSANLIHGLSHGISDGSTPAIIPVVDGVAQTYKDAQRAEAFGREAVSPGQFVMVA